MSLFCCLGDDVIDNCGKDCCCVYFENDDNGRRGAPVAERLIWYISPLLLIEIPALLRAGSREGAGMVFAYSLMMIYSLGSLVVDCGIWSFLSHEFADNRRGPLDSDEIDEEVGDSSIVGDKSHSKIEVITLPMGRLGVYFKDKNKRSSAKVSRFESFSPLVGVLEEGNEVVSLYIPGDELHTNVNSLRLGKLLADSSHVANRELTVCCKSANDEEYRGTEARNDDHEREKKYTMSETVTLPIGRLGVYFVGNKKSGVKISRVESSSPLVGALGEGAEIVSLYVPGDKLYSNIGSLHLGKALLESSNVVNRKLKVRKRYDKQFAIIHEESRDCDGGDAELSF
jgi:hypothetical protein